MTTPMFPIDQQANDDLLIAEAQRKQDLIDHAIRRFAPHLANKPDVRLINLYSTNATLRKEIRSIAGGKTIVVENVLTESNRKDVNEVAQLGARLELPPKADLVATKSALNTKTEWLAARLHALPVVLPEATDYLLGCLAKAGVLTIVGADQA